MNRNQLFDTLEQAPDIEVLIIGGGINGIGTFRELALQGVKVVLVEANDYCSGASATSSHMLHGGIRYLENGEFRLVREALHERNRLLKNAPHYAKPLPTTIPIFRWFSGFLNAPLKFLRLSEKPSERGAVIIKLGLMMYDLFARADRTMPTHSFHGRTRSLQNFPALSQDIVSTATYYDAYMPYPERLCLDLIRDAVANPNARALNYAKVTQGTKTEVQITDQLTGRSVLVRPKIVVNAAGPWIDFVNTAIGEPTRFIGGTKGSHIVVDNQALYDAAGGSEIFFENKDGRIVLIFPYMGKTMIGTTDIRIDNPDDAVCTPEEEAYILSLVKQVFPDIVVDPSQIVFRFSGVRPLPRSTSATTGTISRDHSIVTLPPGDKFAFPVYSLVGGKWTTFRAFSEQAADIALAGLGVTRKVDTKTLPIGGGKDFPTDEAARQRYLAHLQKTTELEASHLSILLDRYGTFAAQVAAYMSQGNDQPLASAPHYTRREVEFLALHEDIVHIDDFMLRRSLLAMLGHNSHAVVTEIGGILARVFDWTDTQLNHEVDIMQERLADKHGVVSSL